LKQGTSEANSADPVEFGLEALVAAGAKVVNVRTGDGFAAVDLVVVAVQALRLAGVGAVAAAARGENAGEEEASDVTDEEAPPVGVIDEAAPPTPIVGDHEASLVEVTAASAPNVDEAEDGERAWGGWRRYRARASRSSRLRCSRRRLVRRSRRRGRSSLGTFRILT
jgi:hypothetical protein